MPSIIHSRVLPFLREQRATIIFLLALLTLRAACADWMLVPSGSMNPTILEGDYIFVNKHAYGWRVPFTLTRITEGADPQRGEIAVFYSPLDNTRLVKRVIGIPGDTIEMRDETLVINGQPLNYAVDANQYALLADTAAQQPRFYTEQLGNTPHTVMMLPLRYAERSFGPIVVPADHYLMLGDSRDNSADSRYFGLVPRKQFVGRANHVLASFNPDAYYLPRTERWWQVLN